jgi:hypothetical protein
MGALCGSFFRIYRLIRQEGGKGATARSKGGVAQRGIRIINCLEGIMDNPLSQPIQINPNPSSQGRLPPYYKSHNENPLAYTNLFTLSRIR